MIDHNPRAALRGFRLFASTLVLLALVGAWIGHTLEYLRVWGAEGLRGELASSRHIYMVPLAGVLAVRLLALWVILGALQIGAYLTQENLEALVSGGHAPLLRSITGIHAMAPLIQLDVALVLAAGMVLGIGRMRRRQRRVAGIESLLRVVFGMIGRPPAGSPMRRWRVAIRPRFARHLWKRPPPLGPALRR